MACAVSLGLKLPVTQQLLYKTATQWQEKLSDQARRMEKAKNAQREEFKVLLDVFEAILQGSRSDS